MGLKKDRFKKVPISKVSGFPKETGTYDIYIDYFWPVVDDCILLFDGHIKQCNADERITKRIVEVEGYPATEYKQIPVVSFEHDFRD